MHQYGVANDQLEQVFLFENGNFQLIAKNAPGSNGREKTINAFLLTGLGQFLTTGEAKFDDQVGRDACTLMGCFNAPNHANYITKGKGNYLSGSKKSGWTVTTPGLKLAADLVKGLANSEA
ncbi:MAG: hypothetical protein EBY21_02370 [Alphaproteobacteria bacterium]|nr:hypothetical protein [Alphaproteobacteria bacterium]